MAVVLASLAIVVAAISVQASAVRLGSLCKQDCQKQCSEIEDIHLAVLVTLRIVTSPTLTRHLLRLCDLLGCHFLSGEVSVFNCA